MTIDQQIVDLKSSSDIIARNDFIEAYIPYIVGQTSKVTNRYIEDFSDERFIIALEAFNEAMERYDSDKGHFLSYAATVIRSRLVDWMRQEQRQASRYESKAFIEITSESNLEEKYLLKEEVYACKKVLAKFGIVFDDLVDKAPKKVKTARKITDIGRRASEDQEIVAQLYKNYWLPMQAIAQKLKVTKRVLKTHRDFIVTVMIILIEDFRFIGEFLMRPEER